MVSANATANATTNENLQEARENLTRCFNLGNKFTETTRNYEISESSSTLDLCILAIKQYLLAEKQYMFEMVDTRGSSRTREFSPFRKWYLVIQCHTPTAAYKLAYFYENGEYGIEKNEENEKKALDLYKHAAKNGHTDAQYILGLRYEKISERKHSESKSERDTERSTERSAERTNAMNQAIEFYKMAAENGHSGAQLSLGLCYQIGNGVDVNHRRAYELFSQVCDGDGPKNIKSIAQCSLASLYQLGFGTPKNPQRALKYYQLSADYGYTPAKFNLGMCYKNGIGVKKNVKQAFELFSQAAFQGCKMCCCQLGLCYEEGKGVEKDLKEAAKWYSRAGVKHLTEFLEEGEE